MKNSLIGTLFQRPTMPSSIAEGRQSRFRKPARFLSLTGETEFRMLTPFGMVARGVEVGIAGSRLLPLT